MRHNNTNLISLTFVLIIEIILIFFISIKLFGNDVNLALSFIINTILSFFIIIINSRKDIINIGANSVAIFILLFFVVAPVMQTENYIEGSLMVNNIPYNSKIAIYANLQISLFLIAFIFTYFHVSKKQFKVHYTEYSTRLKPIILISSILITIAFAGYVLNSMLKINDDENQSIIVSLILKKSVFMVPVATFAIFSSNKRKITLTILLLGCIILFLKNPISERRNAIGPLYMAIIFFLFTFLYKTNFKNFIYIFIIFFVLFPLSSLITNSYSPIYERIEVVGNFISNGISLNYYENYFNTLHYDAWSNLCAMIEYVDQKGLSYGVQLIGGIFFFIPRFIWPNKPIGSGHLLANDFLIPQHHLWLSNISCPFISEGYINFGILGILLFAIVLGFIIKKFESWLNSQDPLYKFFGIYSSFWLFYLMRGDLMSSWAYLCGAYIGIIIIPKTINKLLKPNGFNIR
jgi:hypothetical protein